MKSRHVSAVLSLVLAFSAVAAPIETTYVIRDGGQRRTFVVAGDEIHQRREPKRLAIAGTSEEARATAAQIAEADLVLYEKGVVHSQEMRRLLTRGLLVQLTPGTDGATIATAAGITLAGPAPGRIGDRFIMRSSAAPGSALEAAARLRSQPGVISAEPLLATQHTRYAPPVLIPNDPFFSEQFHLLNTGQRGALPGIDVNITNVWATYRGSGVTIGIVDDGLERTHPDLAPNYSAALSHDFNHDDNDPLPPPYDFDDHGTACAGIAAARGNNGLGVCGAAFEATLAGLRLISAPTTDEEDAQAFAFRNDAIDVKSNSWGPSDNGRTLEGPGPLAHDAIVEGVSTGRAGHGTIYVFASGNGGFRDGANFDGFITMRETIAVSAVAPDGFPTGYAEPGANIVCVAPSNEASIGTTTTDRQGDDGYNFGLGASDLPDLDYTRQFGGTSSAAPLVAGCIALMLQANPNLGWRDVQEILIRTSRKIDPADPDWQVNGAGFHFHHFLGAGLVDADAAVQMAQGWINLGPNISLSEIQANLATPIPDGKRAGITQIFNFTDTRFRVEHAALTVDILHASRGQLEISLESPSGTISRLADPRPRDTGDHLLGWTFLSRQMWGETAQGVWKVRVVDRVAGTVGTLQGLKLELFGSAPLGYPVPNGYTVVAESNGNEAVDPGETVTLALSLKNDGASTESGIVAVLLATSGVGNPSGPQGYGTLAPGTDASRNFTFTANGALGATILATVQITDGVGNVGNVTFPITLGKVDTETFSSDRPLQLPDFDNNSGSGNASLYPSTIAVSGLPGNAVITGVVLQLEHLAHDRSADLDFLLVSPAGQSVIPMSDAGSGPLDDISLTFEDAAPIPLPTSIPIFGGIYRPTNHGATIDVFPGPVPRKPYGAHFAALNGSNPNGEWKLFIRDDHTHAFGGLGAWSLKISYAH